MSDREMYLGAMAGSYEGELPPPNTRSLKWMAKILGADIVTEPVQSAEEAYLEAIYENGGGGVTVEALTVTENGRYAEEGQTYNPVLAEVPQVSGNPNYVETISGTLANPWGEYAASELFSAARSGDLTMYISASVAYSEGEAASTATLMFFPISGLPTFGFTKPGASAAVLRFARVGYSTDGALGIAVSGNINVNNETQELLQIPGDTATTLAIIHHPMTGAMQMAESATFGGNA